MTEKSIAEIVAEIKENIPDLCAQFDAIEDDESSQASESLWQIAENEVAIILIIYEQLADEPVLDKNGLSLFLGTQRSLKNIAVALEMLMLSESFSHSLLSEIQSVQQLAKRINTLLDELYTANNGDYSS